VRRCSDWDVTQTQPATAEAREQQLLVRLACLEQALHAEQVRCEQVQKERDQVQRERDQLRAAYEQVRLELELLKRRLFVAKAERVDTAQLELEFAGKLAALCDLGQKLNQQTAAGDAPSEQAQNEPPPPPPNKEPKLIFYSLGQVRPSNPAPVQEIGLEIPETWCHVSLRFSVAPFSRPC